MSTDKRITLGRALKAFRVTEELSQAGVARKLGISTTYLSDLENGQRNLSPGNAAKYARILGMPVEILVALSVQDQINAAGLKLRVRVEAE
jgi:transcriptional regulator with XRE-family HTH domain